MTHAMGLLRDEHRDRLMAYCTCGWTSHWISSQHPLGDGAVGFHFRDHLSEIREGET